MDNKTTGAVMIVGGGIGAIQSALDLADSGFYVYMVEKQPSIGGTMAQLDKTFPTNDCSMCIMSPKLVEVGRHRNIELITSATVEEVKGKKGDFNVTVLQKARYIDMSKCIACGLCTEKCPKKVDDIFNGRLIKRKAVYIQYPQAVPLKYSIDRDSCIYLQSGKCGACQRFCPAGAVNFEDKDREIQLNVGSIILSPGFKTYDPSGDDRLGYKTSADIMTSLEFERVLSASGPTLGHLARMSDHKEPKKIAWIQCVGSRDINTCDNFYCSSVCCMYAIKQAIIAKEHSHTPLDCAIFYMDMRTHGKGFEECFNSARDIHEIRFERARIHSISKGRDGMHQIMYPSEDGTLRTESFDIVVLSVGMEISSDVLKLSQDLGIDLTSGRFASTPSFNPTVTSREGIYACGAFQGPKDIPQTVIEAGSAAMSAGSAICNARNTMTRELPQHEERRIAGESPRIGVFVCHCGINIGGVIDVPAVRDYAKDLPYVKYVADNMYSCSQDTQDNIVKVIEENNLNRIIVAACTPRTHEPLFQETILGAGLNKYLFEMVNIRNHGSWVHKDSPGDATEKAKDLVRMAAAKAALLQPLEESELQIDQNVLIVGGGISGMSAAKALADQGYHVHLIEKDSELGGQAKRIFRTARGEDVRAHLSRLIATVKSHDKIHVHAESQIKGVEGFVGSFDTTIISEDKTGTIHHGVAIVATGALEHKPDEYLYGKDARVISGLDLDERFLAEDQSLKSLKSAVFIQCAGSREPERTYCSRVCCTHSMMSALRLKELNPHMDIYVLYRDMRTYGEREALFRSARQRGVKFIRHEVDRKPAIEPREKDLLITVRDHVLCAPLQIRADLLVLASAVVSRNDEALAQFFKVPMNESGFFMEAHVKLAPSEFATNGVFLCGTAHYPKPIDESVAQAQAAASRAVTLLARKTIMTSGTVAYTNPQACSSCGICISICPFSAASFKESGPFSGRASVNPVLCKGCGLCVSSCRSGALNLRGFETGQIMAMINEM
jgi:heterodisulfide reductase subunit A2